MVVLLLLLLCASSFGVVGADDIDPSLLLVRSSNENVPPADSIYKLIRRTNTHTDFVAHPSVLSGPRERDFEVMQEIGKAAIEERHRMNSRLVYPRQAFFDEFRDFDEYMAFIDDIVTRFPSVATHVAFPEKSDEGRDIRGVKITSSKVAGNKPSIVILGNIHAREWLGGSSVAWAIEQLCMTYGSDANTTLLVDRFEWHMFPIANPDGFAYTHSSTHNRMWRKTRSNNNSPTKCIGVDPNRNMVTPNWHDGSSGDPCSDVFRGYTQLSTGVTKGLAAYSTALVAGGGIALYIDQHCYAPSFTSVWGHKRGFPPEYPEMERYMKVAVDAIHAVNGLRFSTGTAANLLGVGAGGTDDHHYENFGVVTSFTCECRGSSFIAPPSDIRPSGRELLAAYKALAYTIAQELGEPSTSGGPGAGGAPPASLVAGMVILGLLVVVLAVLTALFLRNRRNKAPEFIGADDLTNDQLEILEESDHDAPADVITL